MNGCGSHPVLAGLWSFLSLETSLPGLIAAATSGSDRPSGCRPRSARVAQAVSLVHRFLAER